MPRSFRRSALISLAFLASTGILFAQVPRSASGKTHKTVAHKPIVLPPLPSGPLPQVPMDQLPSTPPQVTFQGGMLTIVAQNSTLGDILREVHKRTGASIDVPASATERVAAHLGPGPARNVLADLLNGSAFNYVMVGSPADPAVLSSLALTPKPARSTTETAAYQAPQYPQAYTPPPGSIVPAPGMGPGGAVVHQAQSGDDEADSADEETDDNSAEDQEDQEDQSGNGAGEAAQPNAGPKTPEQILEMLRQRQQQTQPGQQLPKPILPPQQQTQPENQ
ncbi:MAG TPA: hypothetical protein VLT90_07515 [Terriglobales bacterium]|nr:hypothetical protein [Terriglobales bacterium]